MKANEGPTYADLVAKLKELRSGSAELDRQIDAILELLPGDPEKLAQPAADWHNKIKPALLQVQKLLDDGINHYTLPTRC